MSIYKKVILFPVVTLLSLLFLMVFQNDIVFADETYDASATESDSVSVVLTQTEDNYYNAVVSGNGNMKNYNAFFDKAPWSTYMRQIKTIVVENGVLSIGDYAFAQARSVNSITFCEGLKTIGEFSFQRNAATDISIPKSVTIIKEGAFSGTQATLTINGNDTSFKGDVINNPVGKKVIAFEDSTVVKDWIYEGKDDFGNILNNQTELEKKDSYNYNADRTKVSKYVANGKDIVIPDSVRIIGESTFESNIDIVSADLNNVTTIEANAFKDCSSLESVIIPSTVATIDPNAFSGCDNVSIYGNRGSVAETFANEHNYPFEVMKPYLSPDVNSSIDKEMPTGASFDFDLSQVFLVNYSTELKYELKINDEDYQLLQDDHYVFMATEAGLNTLSFRAIDTYGETSDQSFSAKIVVVNNTAPVINPENESIDETALFGENVQVNLNNVFLDAEGDELHYKCLNTNESNDWNDSYDVNLINGLMTVSVSSIKQLGKETVFLVKAYDRWNTESEESFRISVTTHSVLVTINKGLGVHSLDDISFGFHRDDIDDITKPVFVDGNCYYFDVSYQTRTNSFGEEVYSDGYVYNYEIKLEGCNNSIGSIKPIKDANRATNTIEVSFVNPAQAEADAKAVADLIKAIDNLGDITLDSEDAVNAAQAAYDDLYDDLKPQVTNYNELLQARLTLADLKLEAAKKDLEEAEKAKEKADQDKKDAEAKIQTAENEVKQAKAELNGVKEELAAMKLTVKGLKVTSKKKKFTVKWKKNAKASGYTVQYKLSGAKKFKTLKTLAKTKVVSKKLKKGKKYEFRVATYKKVNGKKVFGKWTEAKIVKCK